MTAKRRIRLTESEVVAPHGTRKNLWYVYDGQRWKALARASGVDVEQLSQGPGTIWERALHWEAEVGSWFSRVDSQPRPARHDDPMRYLEREVRGRQERVARRYFVLTEEGKLAQKPWEDAPR